MIGKRKQKNSGSPEAKCTTIIGPENVSGGKRAVQERPRICLIDVPKSIAAAIHEHGLTCYEGSLGSLVEVNNTSQQSAHRCLLNYDFPPNLHEYDIVVVDLQQPETVPYILKDHVQAQTKGHLQVALLSSFPETIFDPRAAAANELETKLKPLMKRNSILLIFAAEQEDTQYHQICTLTVKLMSSVSKKTECTKLLIPSSSHLKEKSLSSPTRRFFCYDQETL